MIDLEDLKAFLLEANMPHATGTSNLNSQPDKSRTITFSHGPWYMHDNFFGGEPYGGRQVIFYKDEPVWICAYYGRIIHTEPRPEIYDFLREALQHGTLEKPYRGPDSYEKGEYRYVNAVNGDSAHFSGNEYITENDQRVYEASYMGGLIDQRVKGSL